MSGLILLDCLLLVLLPLTVVIHELSHAIAGVALRLRVVRFQIALVSGRSHVYFAPPANAAALPARMVTATLAGPLANLLTAAAAFAYDQRQANPFVHLGLVGAGVVWTYTGVANLVPFRFPHGPSDGLHVALWIARPARMRQELANRYLVAVTRRRVAAVKGGAEDARLRTKRVTRIRRRFSLARWPHFVAALLGNAYLRSAIVQRAEVPKSTVDSLETMATLGLRHNPDVAGAHVAMAMVRLPQHHPTDARLLLDDVDQAERLYRIAADLFLITAAMERHEIVAHHPLPTDSLPTPASDAANIRSSWTPST